MKKKEKGIMILTSTRIERKHTVVAIRKKSDILNRLRANSNKSIKGYVCTKNLAYDLRIESYKHKYIHSKVKFKIAYKDLGFIHNIVKVDRDSVQANKEKYDYFSFYYNEVVIIEIAKVKKSECDISDKFILVNNSLYSTKCYSLYSSKKLAQERTKLISVVKRGHDL